MKNKLYFPFLISCIFLIQSSYAQISGVVNSYARVTSLIGSTLTIDNLSLAPGLSTAVDAFGIGKKVMIIQMKGASINTSNTSSFGTISTLNEAGNYELSEVISLVGIGPTYTVQLMALSRSYNVNASVQIVSVPQYTDITVAGNITATAWSNTLGRGGVVSFEVTGTLTLAANIDVSAQGFRGGQPNATGMGGCINSITYRDVASSNFAQKGESIADYSQNGIAGNEYARGAIANGGGGGNSHNAGGGGGSNVSIGGNGGTGWTGAGACGGSTANGGGLGGYALTYSSAENKLFMGGGGGAGQQNNNLASRGGHGGGIILVRAGTLTTTCMGTYGFYANGENAPNSGGNDGAGGGGGAGTIFLEVITYNLPCTIVARTNGGNGGNVTDNAIHGGGGGGGVGPKLVKNTPPTNANFGSTAGTQGLDCNGSCGSSSGTPGGSMASTTSSGWAASGMTSALPIELEVFKAFQKNQKVELNWTTITEKNTDYFEIERTNNLKTIESIGQIKASGNSLIKRNYTKTDENPPQGLVYYRLKSVDFDGSTSYSPWVAVELDKLAYQIYPNPTHDILKILVNDVLNQPKTLWMYDRLGNLIKKENFTDEVQIQVSDFAKGMYIVKIVAKNQVFTERIVFE